MSDHLRFYDHKGGWHSVSMAQAVMAAHLVCDHGWSVRRANRSTTLTDLEVKYACQKLRGIADDE